MNYGAVILVNLDPSEWPRWESLSSFWLWYNNMVHTWYL